MPILRGKKRDKAQKYIELEAKMNKLKALKKEHEALKKELKEELGAIGEYTVGEVKLVVGEASNGSNLDKAKVEKVFGEGAYEKLKAECYTPRAKYKTLNVVPTKKAS